MIGDPRPTTERAMISKEQVRHNFECLKKQVEDIFGFEVVNNNDWYQDINVIDFLRDYGKYFNVNYMLDKDIIRRRLDSGITYTEFSYMILQALDFKHLHECNGVDLQCAGSDQWGNITAGIDLIRKSTGDEVYGFTMPLVTDSQGKKFGKSEGNALWLDKNKTSSYQLYQYLINTDDSLVIKYLKIFTFLSKEEIEKLEKSNQEEPEKRLAHQALAKEIITDLHGEEEYLHAKELSNVLFTEEFTNLTSKDIQEIFTNQEIIMIKSNNLVDLLLELKAAKSKREAREFISNGAIKINGQKNIDLDYLLEEKDFLDNTYIIIKRGKKNYYIGKKGNS